VGVGVERCWRREEECWREHPARGGIRRVRAPGPSSNGPRGEQGRVGRQRARTRCRRDTLTHHGCCGPLACVRLLQPLEADHTPARSRAAVEGRRARALPAPGRGASGRARALCAPGTRRGALSLSRRARRRSWAGGKERTRRPRAQRSLSVWKPCCRKVDWLIARCCCCCCCCCCDGRQRFVCLGLAPRGAVRASPSA